jgi:hypothetical protein
LPVKENPATLMTFLPKLLGVDYTPAYIVETYKCTDAINIRMPEGSLHSLLAAFPVVLGSIAGGDGFSILSVVTTLACTIIPG